MDTLNIKEIEALVKKAVGRCRVDRLDKEEITQDLLLEVWEKRGKIKDLPAYIKQAARNRVISLGAKQTRREILLKKKTPSLAARGVQRLGETGELVPGEFDAVDESSELEWGRSRTPGIPAEEAPAADAALRRDEFIQKSVRLVDLLYRISLTRADNPNVSFLFCLDRAINALSAAKTEVDDAILGSREDFGVYKFRRFRGLAISRFLQDELDALWSRRQSIKGLPRTFSFPDFVLDAIPKLRADPIMLILRVFYKKFKVGSGKYGARGEIRKIILELKKSEVRTTDIFASVSESTNFETLRKKIYRKSVDPFYDKIANWICEVCSPAK